MNDYGFLNDLDFIDPYVDTHCQWLVDYIANGLNYAIKRRDPSLVAVRATRSYDAVLPDLSCFPLLKVYRKQQSSDMSLRYKGQWTCSYSLVLPEQDNIPGIGNWLCVTVSAILQQLGEVDRGCPVLIDHDYPITHEFRIMVNDLQQPVYCYIKVNFHVIETHANL